MNLKDKICLITAGPTYESIDPVRFIGNRSSGKMGYELAKSFTKKGAKVYLIIGPNSLQISSKEFDKLIQVESSEDMYEAVMAHIDQVDIGVFSAAVADYKPKHIAKEKIKKNDESFSIELVKTKDILKSVGLNKKPHQLIIGFALETENELEHAKAKIQKKNLDAIILNSLRNVGAGFQHNTNQITIIDKHNNIQDFELKTKSEVAVDIVKFIETLN